MTKAKKVWTEKHYTFAKSEFLKLASKAMANGDGHRAGRFVELAQNEFGGASERGFLSALKTTFVCNAERILATVSARAEGREIVTVETFWRVKLASGEYWPANEEDAGSDTAAEALQFRTLFVARAHAKRATAEDGARARVVRVTLTRRRTTRAA